MWTAGRAPEFTGLLTVGASAVYGPVVVEALGAKSVSETPVSRIDRVEKEAAPAIATRRLGTHIGGRKKKGDAEGEKDKGRAHCVPDRGGSCGDKKVKWGKA